MERPSSHRHDPAAVREAPEGRTAPPRFVLDRAAVRSVDRAALEEYGIPGIVLMENASRALAREALAMLAEGANPDGVALIICGSGNNGGDGWALARHLHNARPWSGARPVIAPIKDPRPGTDAGTNCAICRKMGLEEIAIDDLDRHRDADLVVDAIFGTGLDRDVTGEAARIIEWINATGRPVLAVDVPSGLDCDTGRSLGVCVTATRTVSFVGFKPAFAELHAQPVVGEVVIGDIGSPRELTEGFGRPLHDRPPISHQRG